MAQKIDGIIYPTDVKQVLKDRPLAIAFAAYLKKAGLLPDLLFILSKDKNDRLYRNFIDPNGRNSVNIGAGTRNPIVALAADANAGRIRWNDDAITDAIETAKNDVTRLLKSDRLIGTTAFYGSAAFKKVHKTRVEKNAPDINAAIAAVTKKIDKKKLRVLGYENVTNRNLMIHVKQMAAYILIGNLKKAKEAYDKIKRIEPANSAGANNPFMTMEKLLKTTKVLPA